MNMLMVTIVYRIASWEKAKITVKCLLFRFYMLTAHSHFKHFHNDD